MADLESARREERDFLLASLDDLEAEFAAGDLDADDYNALKSDYTTRTARVIRALDRSSKAEAPVQRDWKRTGLWVALIVVVAGLSGLLIAEFSGERRAGDTISGETRETSRELLFEANQLLGQDPSAAMEIYDEVLEIEPSNAEALTYRGWLTNLGGDPAAAETFLRRARLSDPEYPDALVFSAVIALNLGDPEMAATHLATLDSLAVPPFINQLINAQGLRIGIAEALIGEGEADTVDASGLSIIDLEVAAYSSIESAPERGARLLGEVARQRPDDPEARAALGIYNIDILFVHGDQLSASDPDAIASILSAAADELDVALELDPEHAAALVYRSFTAFFLEDLNGAQEALAAYDALDARRDDLDALIASYGLRDQLE